MSYKNLLVLLVSVFALFAVMPGVSAFGEITTVEVAGTPVIVGGNQVADVNLVNLAGETIPVRVVFQVDSDISAYQDGDTDLTIDIEDVRIKVELFDDIFASDLFDAIQGGTYTRTVEQASQ